MVAAPTIIPASVFGQNAPGKSVTMGFIGMRNRGIGVMEAFLAHADVQGVAVCDVEKLHFTERGGKRSRDYGRAAGKTAVEKIYSSRTDSGA